MVMVVLPLLLLLVVLLAPAAAATTLHPGRFQFRLARYETTEDFGVAYITGEWLVVYRALVKSRLTSGCSCV